MRCRIALALTLAISTPLGAPSPVVAATSHEQNIGHWDYACRVQQVNSQETVTMGADTSGPLGNVAGFAAGICQAFLNVNPGLYENGYDVFPLTEQRPGLILCSFVYRYGGYWQTLPAPYINNTGAAIITVRDTPNDVSNAGQTYGEGDCSAVTGALDQINVNNGYNTTDHPLAAIQFDSCSGCGGGGGFSGGFNGTLPKAPKPRHPARKVLVCTRNGNKKVCRTR